jgi:hypothetical protein
VWLKSKQRKNGMANSKKLQPRFIGPFKIIEVLPYNTYRLSRNGKESVEHEGRIKLYVNPTDYALNNQLPPPKKLETPKKYQKRQTMKIKTYPGRMRSSSLWKIQTDIHPTL